MTCSPQQFHISGFYLTQIRKLLQIENCMGHIFPDFTALEHLVRSRLVKTHQFFGKACKSRTLADIGQSSKRCENMESRRVSTVGT